MLYIYTILSFSISRFDSDHILIDKTKVSNVSESEEVEQVYIYIYRERERESSNNCKSGQTTIYNKSIAKNTFNYLVSFFDRRTV